MILYSYPTSTYMLKKLELPIMFSMQRFVTFVNSVLHCSLHEYVCVISQIAAILFWTKLNAHPTLAQLKKIIQVQ
jgi:hypothetical protein